MADHALLSASGAKKWVTCPPSARLEETFPDETSSAAAEGTKAHELVELMAREQFLDQPAPGHLLTPAGLAEAGFTHAMIEAAREFIVECKKIIDPLKASGKPYTVLIEQRLDYSPWVPEGFGTGDLVIVSGHCVWVRDFKYGKGVPVDSEENYQMMLYGLGAHNELSFAYEDINEFDLGIVQPRIHNNSSWRITTKDLLAWGEMIKPIAQLAWEGKGEFKPGPHCESSFCRARFTCKARASACLAASAGITSPDLMLAEEITELLPELESIEKWAKGLREYALKQAVDHGARYEGFKLVEGRSNRFITDKKVAMVRLTANGYPQPGFMTEPELVGVTALEELIGSKKGFNELLGDLVSKPPGKPALVPISDKRPEWQPVGSADELFID